MLGELTWTCMICGEERDDHLIGVRKHHRMMGRVELTENIRYCVDRPDCIEGAEVMRLTPGAEDIERP